MIMFRSVAVVIAVLSGIAFAACGGGGSGPSPSPYGGATAAPTSAPALGTNKPAASGDPYSDYGY